MKSDVNTIIINGVSTHNLKNISIRLKKSAINLIIGPSGSGKSSLAYDTIAQIGQYELLSIGAIATPELEYKVSSYCNVPVTIPISQLNVNNNVRSTVGTYFNLNRDIALLFGGLMKLDEGNFTLNKEENVCSCCHGLGFVSRLNPNLLIDYSKSPREIPFKCWNRHKDFFAQMLVNFCLENKIDPDKPFTEIPKSAREQLLHEQSKIKFTVKYKLVNRIASRTTKYYGPFHEKQMLSSVSVGNQYYSNYQCEACQGRKYSPLVENYKIFGVSIGELMTTPFNKLEDLLNKFLKSGIDEAFIFILNRLISFVRKANELSLGHLYLHRSIPTLSGGEFQRLRLVQLFNSQLSDMLIILDEPLAGLSEHEQALVYENILSLAQKHTLLIVDHGDKFLKVASNVYALGPGSGEYGGAIVDTNSYVKQQNVIFSPDVIPCSRIVNIKISDKIYSYRGLDMKLALNSLNLIYGKSGIGKTTILRDYLPQQITDYEYISQKPLVGNKNSSVATALNIFDGVTKLFSKRFNKDKKFFSNLTGAEGACPECSGAGYLDYTYGEGLHAKLLCNKCQGTGFNDKILSFSIDGVNMFDIWHMTLEDVCNFLDNKDATMHKVCTDAIKVSLGHLHFGQPTSTLSGGENIRLKVLKNARTAASFLGIDEPFKGLSNTETLQLIDYFNTLVRQGKTLIVADHSAFARKCFAYVSEIFVQKEILTASRVIL